MSDMKCPFCGQELDCMGKYTDGSSKWLCNKCGLFGDKKLFDEIIRTRKALEWARHFLKEIRFRYLFEKDNPSRQNKWADTALQMYNFAEEFFDDYDKTALEQKDK